MSKNNYSCELCLDLKWVGNEKSVGSLDFGKLIPCQCQKEQISKDREEILSKSLHENELKGKQKYTITFNKKLSLN